MAPLFQTENDPVMATYSVYLTPPAPPKERPPRSLLIQYPDRSSRRPYGDTSHQTPTSFRLKPNTGLVELDIPIDTAQNYNQARGNEYADALHYSRVLSAGGSQGFAGGFNTTLSARFYRQDEDGDVDVKAIPQYGHAGSIEDARELKTQTLGGKIAKPSDGDPVYMLGTFRGAELHLSHLDSLIQVRPQLHHLDAAEEVARGSVRSVKKESEKPAGPETRAVEIKVKTAEEKNADRNRKKSNAERLFEIQSEPWQTYKWLDSDAPRTTSQFRHTLYHPQNSITSPDNLDDQRHLQSVLKPPAYLDAISAPRIDLTVQSFPHASTSSRSHLGLMGKVRGRERERRRRKKNDADRKAAAAEAESTARHTTAAAIEHGKILTEDTEDLARQGSEEAAAAAAAAVAAAAAEEESSSDSSDSSSGEDETAAMIEREQAAADAADLLSSSAKTTAAAAMVEPSDEIEVLEQPTPTQSVPSKRGRGRPRKSAGHAQSDPMVIDD